MQKKIIEGKKKYFERHIVWRVKKKKLFKLLYIMTRYYNETLIVF